MEADLTKKHYKLSCVGIDNRGCPSRLNFFVYEVEGPENARRIVRKDKKRRQMMRTHNIEWRTAALPAVECTKMGKVLESNLGIEMEIMVEEAKKLIVIKREYARAEREKYWASLEPDEEPEVEKTDEESEQDS